MNRSKLPSGDLKNTQAELEIIERHRRIVDGRKRLKKKQRELDADTVEHLRQQIAAHKGSEDDVRRDVARYARDVLGLSASMASSRVSAAFVAFKRPATIGDLREGRVTFAALRALEPYIHFPKLLDAAVGRTRREVIARATAHLKSLNIEADSQPNSDPNVTHLPLNRSKAGHTATGLRPKRTRKKAGSGKRRRVRKR